MNDQQMIYKDTDLSFFILIKQIVPVRSVVKWIKFVKIRCTRTFKIINITQTQKS